MNSINDGKFIGQNDFLIGDYEAEVVDNVDPNNIARVKIYIDGQDASKTNTNLLRWAVRVDPVDFGSLENLSKFSVPSVGSKVMVRFFNGDPQKPYYWGRLYTGGNKIDSSQNEKLCISKDPLGNTFKSDLDGKVIEGTIVSDVTLNLKGESYGAIINIDKDLNISVSGKVTVNVEDDADITVVGDANLTAKAVNVTSDTADINTTTSNLNSSNINLNALTLIKLGATAAAEPLVKGLTLQTLINAFILIYNSHTHATPAGLSGAPNETGTELNGSELSTKTIVE